MFDCHFIIISCRLPSLASRSHSAFLLKSFYVNNWLESVAQYCNCAVLCHWSIVSDVRLQLYGYSFNFFLLLLLLLFLLFIVFRRYMNLCMFILRCCLFVCCFVVVICHWCRVILLCIFLHLFDCYRLSFFLSFFFIHFAFGCFAITERFSSDLL